MSQTPSTTSTSTATRPSDISTAAAATTEPTAIVNGSFPLCNISVIQLFCICSWPRMQAKVHSQPHITECDRETVTLGKYAGGDVQKLPDRTHMSRPGTTFCLSRLRLYCRHSVLKDPTNYSFVGNISSPCYLMIGWSAGPSLPGASERNWSPRNPQTKMQLSC